MRNAHAVMVQSSCQLLVNKSGAKFVWNRAEVLAILVSLARSWRRKFSQDGRAMTWPVVISIPPYSETMTGRLLRHRLTSQ